MFVFFHKQISKICQNVDIQNTIILILKYQRYKYLNKQTSSNPIKKQKIMPRLKKLSKIAKQDESNSYYSVNKYRIGEPDDDQSQQASRNKSKSNSKSSQQSVSDQQSQRTQQQSRQVSANPKLNIRQSRQNKPIGKSTQKKAKSRHNADEILKKMQEQYANNEQDTKNGDDQQTSYHIPQDALVILSDNKKRKSKSKDKGNLKIKNKFFADVICKDDIHLQDTSQNKIKGDEAEELRKLQQEYKIKQAAKMEKHAQLHNQRKSIIEGKANRLKDRLEFKNAHEDVRFKEHMRQTLDNVKDCEEVQIMIEAPKIFKGAGARQADAALYIKNLSQSHFTQTSQKQQSIDGKSLKQTKLIQDKNQKNRKIDRRQFYSQFTKQIKQIRAVEVPTQIDGLFKKSSLDELENQLQNHQHLFREDSRQRNSISGSQMHRSQKSLEKVRRSSQVSRDKQKSERENSNSQSRIERLNSSLHKSKKNSEVKIEVVQQQKSHQQSKQTNKNQCKINNQIANPSNKPAKPNSENSKNKINSQPQQPKQKQKQKQKEKKERKKKQKKNSDPPQQHKRKSRRKNDKTFGKDIKQLFEQEAEDSQNGYGDDGCSSQSGDDSSVDSMIDRKEVKFVAKNEREARKKFMEEEMKRDEEMLIKIKQKIAAPRRIKCQQSSQSRQRRKRRLDQARKNFEQQDGKVDQNFVNINQNQNESKENPPQEQDLSKVLLNLQTEIAPTEKPDQKLQSRVVQPKAGKTKSIWQQMKIVNRCQTEGAKQKRGGFLNNTKSVGGNKIKGTKKQKSKSKDKAIIF